MRRASFKDSVESLNAGVQESLNGSELGSRQSVACGLPLRRAYRPQRSCGRVAEGGGLLNRYRVVKPYRGFESLRLRHTDHQLIDFLIPALPNCPSAAERNGEEAAYASAAATLPLASHRQTIAQA